MKVGGYRAGAGRPTRLSPQMAAMLVGYFEALSEKLNGEMPTFQGFSKSIGVSRSTLHYWTAKSPEFAEAVIRCRAIQAAMAEKARAASIRFGRDYAA